MVTVSHPYYEVNEKQQVGQGETRNIQREEKRIQGKVPLELCPVLKEMMSLKKSLTLNGIKGVVTSGVSFQFVERNLRKA